jgi:CTD small phosphatase-like protein 2
MSIKYILISILICYDCSFDVDILNKVYSILKDLLNLNHKNLILIYEHILSKISTDNKENIWVIKLLTLVNSSKNNDFDYSFNFNEYNAVNEYPMSLIEKINFNTGIIIQNVRVLLKNYKTPKVEYLTVLFKKINDKSYEEINNFYQQNILRIENYSGSILDSIILKQNKNVTFNPEPSPYIHTINHKQYTLILDLGETLVHFKVNPENEGEGILKVRPWVTEFLNEMVKFYEIIIFTGATQDYANLLIDAIDENKNYFDYRLYRQHMIILDNEFVKDLTRIGRPLDKVVIVDNMPQNFRLQKENGINIKSFWGEDIYDTALINLTTILTKIAQEGGDIRKGLEKYRNEIVEKVTSNLSKHNS